MLTAVATLTASVITIGLINLLPIPEIEEPTSVETLTAANAFNKTVLPSTEALSPEWVINCANVAKSVLSLYKDAIGPLTVNGCL